MEKNKKNLNDHRWTLRAESRGLKPPGQEELYNFSKKAEKKFHLHISLGMRKKEIHEGIFMFVKQSSVLGLGCEGERRTEHKEGWEEKGSKRFQCSLIFFISLLHRRTSAPPASIRRSEKQVFCSLKSLPLSSLGWYTKKCLRIISDIWRRRTKCSRIAQHKFQFCVRDL